MISTSGKPDALALLREALEYVSVRHHHLVVWKDGMAVQLEECAQCRLGGRIRTFLASQQASTESDAAQVSSSAAMKDLANENPAFARSSETEDSLKAAAGSQSAPAPASDPTPSGGK